MALLHVIEEKITKKNCLKILLQLERQGMVASFATTLVIRYYLQQQGMRASQKTGIEQQIHFLEMRLGKDENKKLRKKIKELQEENKRYYSQIGAPGNCSCGVDGDL